MTEDQIKHMVDRFLGWKLPENFNPDCGISFKRTFNEHTAHPAKYEPIGTNLLDAQQAMEMVRHMLEGLPAGRAQGTLNGAKLGDPHPHWSADSKNEDYPKTIEEWNPHNDPVGQHLALAEKRLRVSIDRDDPRAPAEMALVSRWDLATLIHDWWHRSALLDIWGAERAAKEAAQSPAARAETKTVWGECKVCGKINPEHDRPCKALCFIVGEGKAAPPAQLPRPSAETNEARDDIAKVIQSHVFMRSRGGRSIEIFGFEEAADTILRMNAQPQRSASEESDLPKIPDDDSDFTPDLARKIICKYQTITGDLYAALRSIVQGNLGDAPWQANYETIKQIARNALPEGERHTSHFDQQNIAMTEELKGTFTCPICGKNAPHHHTPEEVKAARVPTIAEIAADCREAAAQYRKSFTPWTTVSVEAVAEIYDRIADKLASEQKAKRRWS
ncbi:hypothetical protein ACRQ5Q_16830 [Bradyrhizobium sp. PMVTL-01]|uniref:hypothetical protein n=1 Tax=Bradyrhizobium sp. PMVTL-01 TaxID=3434999 RepID=UPI003F6F8D3E